MGEEWSTLVNPGAPLPYAVRILTGIKEADLATAPPLEQVAGRLREFLADAPLVGQSVDLDVAQLARQGFDLPNPLLDTFDLGALLLPGLRTYDLASIAQALGIDAAPPHRALADAHLSRQVFLALLARIHKLGFDVLTHVNRLTAARAWPLRGLFVEAELEQRLRLAIQTADGVPSFNLALSQVLAPAEETPGPLTPNSHARRLDVEGLAEALRPGGAIASVLPAYEERPEQLAMLQAVCGALDSGHHLVVEAGTGTGKSLAYLLPALAFAAANNRRVVVSTNTINLQDQLYEKDVPDVARAMDYRVRATVLKGRSNYVCLRRWMSLLRADALSHEEASLLVKTLLWIGQTATGDRAELRLTPEEEIAWTRICSQTEACSPLTCPYHRDGSCFIARARRAAEASHIVIVNHSLLLSDLVANSRVIPDYEHLVVDEAHHLEDEATAQLSCAVALRLFAVPLDVLVGAPGHGGIASVPGAVALLRGAGLAERRVAQLTESADALRRYAREAREHLGALFESVRDLIADRSTPGESAPAVRLTSSVRNDSAWAAAEAQWEDARTSLEAVRHCVAPVLEDLADAAAGGSEVMADVQAELLAAVRQLHEATDEADSIVARPPPETVSWATSGTSFGVSAPGPTLHLAPLDVASQLRTWLLDAKSSVIFTSATLATEESFDYIRQRLGAQDARELALGSPFDYPNAALVFLPTDMPEPNQPGYARRVADAAADVAAALGGRTLVLFTSHAQLRATYELMRQPMERAQVVLMAQGVDGSRSRLLQRFKATDRAVLLGTASFWEGVDVVGDALSALLIARLPFAVPTDPIFAARSEAYDDPFRQYAVPQAILRFKQGFGRLIRSQTDRGIVAVLDRRILTRSYGKAFLGSLPACTVRTAPLATLATLAREWIERPNPSQ